jgi:hypothetical protein
MQFLFYVANVEKPDFDMSFWPRNVIFEMRASLVVTNHDVTYSKDNISSQFKGFPFDRLILGDDLNWIDRILTLRWVFKTQYI